MASKKLGMAAALKKAAGPMPSVAQNPPKHGHPHANLGKYLHPPKGCK